MSPTLVHLHINYFLSTTCNRIHSCNWLLTHYTLLFLQILHNRRGCVSQTFKILDTILSWRRESAAKTLSYMITNKIVIFLSFTKNLNCTPLFPFQQNLPKLGFLFYCGAGLQLKIFLSSIKTKVIPPALTAHKYRVLLPILLSFSWSPYSHQPTTFELFAKGALLAHLSEISPLRLNSEPEQILSNTASLPERSYFGTLFKCSNDKYFSTPSILG